MRWRRLGSRQVLEAVGVEQRFVERASLAVVHLHERRVGDDLPDAAAQRGLAIGSAYGD
jgi:hypothetical protein